MGSILGVRTGFGAISPTALGGGTGDVLMHIINASSGGKVGITHIAFSAFQTNGTAAAQTELIIPFYVLRGSIVPNAAPSPPLPTFSSNPFGIPDINTLAKSGYELLDCGLFCIANNAMPLVYEPGHLEASGNQQLLVLSTSLLDGTTTTPVEVASTNSQTVLGYDASTSINVKLR